MCGDRHMQEIDVSRRSPDWLKMKNPAAIFALALLASFTAWELDYEVFSAVFAAAAAVAAFESARSQ